ncbi:hypothetical protein KVR01_007774 [Diaporthe batatas]|uniref:uncharacterized protein n=1 Tax=Diaporthe batatas TaxID=748121 RepID=UPI001D0560E0|nr:uncharacterized protein KVR01_007774 [Diaporthe batatas]KAG8162009.1 hypothetical protein KVR01_007774 [Diaporthe batatas]
MKFSIAISSLVAAVSAVDLYFHSNNDCGGSGVICRDANPNWCCSGTGRSVAVRGIPSGWALQCRGYSGAGCSTLMTISGNNGNPWICNRSNGFQYTGVGYNFVGRKRDESDPEYDDSNCQRADVLVLADGTEYDLAGLEEDVYQQFVEIGLNATGPADLPGDLQTLLISKE